MFVGFRFLNLVGLMGVLFLAGCGGGETFPEENPDEGSIEQSAARRIIEVTTATVQRDATHLAARAAVFEDPTQTLATVGTAMGNDPVSVRYRPVSPIPSAPPYPIELILQEEQSKDLEVNHPAETVHLISIPGTRVNDVDGRWIGEVIKVNNHVQSARQTWSFRAFSTGFKGQLTQAPLVFGQIRSIRGAEPCVVRIRNVTVNGFEYKLEEWSYQDGVHPGEDLTFVAVKPGQHKMPLRTALTAIRVPSVTHVWKAVASQGIQYAIAGINRATVAAQIQTARGPEPIAIRVDPRDTLGWSGKAIRYFNVRVQEEEAADGVHVGEDVGFLVVGDILGSF